MGIEENKNGIKMAKEKGNHHLFNWEEVQVSDFKN